MEVIYAIIVGRVRGGAPGIMGVAMDCAVLERYRRGRATLSFKLMTLKLAEQMSEENVRTRIAAACKRSLIHANPSLLGTAGSKINAWASIKEYAVC